MPVNITAKMKTPGEVAERYMERELYMPFLTNMSGILSLHDPPEMSELEKLYKKSQVTRIKRLKKIKLNFVERDSISTCVKKNIYHALCELTHAMILDIETLRKLNNRFVKKRKDAIRHLKEILKGSLPEKRQAITEELERLEAFDKYKKTYNEIDCISSWHHIFYDGLFKKLVLRIETKKLTELLSIPMNFKKDRVLQFFCTVLQIIIFRFLHEHSQIPEEEAGPLTKEIITEYMERSRNFF